MTRQQWRVSSLTLALSKLQTFATNRPALEQVPTAPEEASKLLWEAHLRGDLFGQRVLDLGCGPGILAIGAALLGASMVTGIDTDASVLEIARENARRSGVVVTWSEGRVGESPLPEADTVLMNPPFGVQKHGAVIPFLEAGAEVVVPGGALYLFAGPAAQKFIAKLVVSHHLKVEEHVRLEWPFPAVFAHHTQRRGKVIVDRWILRKIKQ
jgi:putative methylase